MNGTEFLTPLGDAFRAIVSHCSDTRAQAQSEVGMENYDFWVVSRARMLEPEPITTARCLLTNPYDPTNVFEQLFSEAAGRGFIAQVAEDEYRLTEKGQHAFKHDLEKGIYAPLSTIETTLSEAELERLDALLLHVIQRMAEAPEVSEKHGFTLNRNSDPGQDPHALIRIYHHLLDILRYRDDTHNATWRPLGVSGPTWETLSFLWEEKEMSDLQEQYKQREHLEGKLEAVLQALVQRGWAEQDGAVYRITETGRSLRQEAEETTNQYYNAPWTCLDEKENEELQGLLVRLSECSIAKDSQV